MNRYAQIDKNNIIKGWYDDGHSSFHTKYKSNRRTI